MKYPWCAEGPNKKSCLSGFSAHKKFCFANKKFAVQCFVCMLGFKSVVRGRPKNYWWVFSHKLRKNKNGFVVDKDYFCVSKYGLVPVVVRSLNMMDALGPRGLPQICCWEWVENERTGFRF